MYEYNPDEDYLIVRNPDAAARAEIVRKVKLNNGYCPNKYERTADTKCHCKEFREHGNCICGLFIKVPCIDVTERS